MLANEHKARRVDTEAGSAFCRPYRGCERLCSLHPVPYDTGKGYADPPGLMIRLAKASSSLNLSYRLETPPLHLDVQTAAMFVRRQNIQHRQLVLFKAPSQERIENGHVRDPRRSAQHGIEKVDGDPRMFRAPQQPFEGKVDYCCARVS